ncbi:hypothetical protein DTO282E5_3985 [Paecilomyces variotii]|nr:hypothetical protein DTO282E5_3985 [Paecilomyces variotii]
MMISRCNDLDWLYEYLSMNNRTYRIRNHISKRGKLSGGGYPRNSPQYAFRASGCNSRTNILQKCRDVVIPEGSIAELRRMLVGFVGFVPGNQEDPRPKIGSSAILCLPFVACGIFSSGCMRNSLSSNKLLHIPAATFNIINGTAH